MTGIDETGDGGGEDAASGRPFVNALARGLDILSCFGSARPELGGTEIAALTGLPQPTVWRLCHTMVRLGTLVPVSGDKLRPGIPLLKLGRAALAGIPLAAAARMPMQALADRFGAASGLGARDGNRMVFVQRCVSEATLVMNLRIGARLPLLSSAVGWGLLLGLPPAEREALMAEHGPADPRWPTVGPALRAALTDGDRTGFVLNLGTFHPGYNTAAVPVRGADGRAAFGLSCAGSASTHSADFLRTEAAPALRAIAAELEAPIRPPARGGRRRPPS